MCRDSYLCVGPVIYVQGQLCVGIVTYVQGQLCVGIITYVQGQLFMCRASYLRAGPVIYVQGQLCVGIVTYVQGQLQSQFVPVIFEPPCISSVASAFYCRESDKQERQCVLWRKRTHFVNLLLSVVRASFYVINLFQYKILLLRVATIHVRKIIQLSIRFYVRLEINFSSASINVGCTTSLSQMKVSYQRGLEFSFERLFL